MNKAKAKAESKAKRDRLIAYQSRYASGQRVYATRYGVKGQKDMPPVPGVLSATWDLDRKPDKNGKPFLFFPLDPRTGRPNPKNAIIITDLILAENRDDAARAYNEAIVADVIRHLGKIRKLRDGFVPVPGEPVPEIKSASITSVWDGHETVVEAPCYVDAANRRVLLIDSSRREISSADDDIGPDNVDDAVGILDTQYVTVDGEEFPVVPKDEYPDQEPDAYWYD